MQAQNILTTKASTPWSLWLCLMQGVGLLSLTLEPTVLMAVSDARGRFIVLDVGAYGPHGGV